MDWNEGDARSLWRPRRADQASRMASASGPFAPRLSPGADAARLAGVRGGGRADRARLGPRVHNLDGHENADSLGQGMGVGSGEWGSGE